MMNDAVYAEENILDSIKNLFNRTKNEHILIGLLANNKGAIEKLLTDGTNPIFTKEEFNANKSKYIKLVKNSISAVLSSPLDSEYIMYNAIYTDWFDDVEEIYQFREILLYNYGDDHTSISSDKLKELKQAIAKYKKGLSTLEKRYKEQISETFNEKKHYSDLTTKLKQMILKKRIARVINWFNKCIQNKTFPLPSYYDDTPFGRYIKELTTIELRYLQIQLNVIEFSIKHNESVANAIASKIKSQVQKDLKPNTVTNESMILCELAMAIEDL